MNSAIYLKHPTWGATQKAVRVKERADLEWESEPLRCEVYQDPDDLDRAFVVFESKIFTFGWVSRSVPVGSSIEIEDVASGWERLVGP